MSKINKISASIFGIISLLTIQNVTAQDVYYYASAFETQPIPFFEQYKKPQAVLTGIFAVDCGMSKSNIEEYVYNWYETYCAKWTGYKTLRGVIISGPYSYDYAKKTWNSRKNVFESVEEGIYKGMYELESPCEEN